jgi:thymidylate synthase (FAD)
MRQPVLDKGYVELLDFMGNDDAPVDAARVSFAKSAENYTDEQNDKLTTYLIDHNHTTPFEMVTFKFRVHAPVLVWWHWVRHRIASYNFVSGRYVPFTEDQFYEIAADEWRLQSKSNKQGSDGLLWPAVGEVVTQNLKDHTAQSFRFYEHALSCGIAREQARVFLPFAAAYYTAIVQMNARSLQNFLTLRRGGDAQSEIRDYADAVYSIVTQTHPRIFP